MASEIISQPDKRPQDGLPPGEFWLMDARDKILTPVDDRGLIDIDQLIVDVKAAIDPAYDWPTNTSMHHFYWPRCDYEGYDAWSENGLAVHFREIAVNKVRVPRYFENVLHQITLPPPMPDPEVMRYRIDAWHVARRLFMSVRQATQTERLSRRRQQATLAGELTAEQGQIGEEIMNETLLRHFRGISRHLGALAAVPQEYWPFSADVTCQLAAGQVGEPILRGWQRRTRAVLLAA